MLKTKITQFSTKISENQSFDKLPPICENFWQLLVKNKMNRVLITLILGLVFMSGIIQSQDLAIESFDKKAVEVVNSFIAALNANSSDEAAAAKACLAYIHKSEFDNSGTGLKQDRMDFSFKKAWQNAKFYQSPVKITRIQKQNVTAVGFASTAQKGTTYKIFIAKKEGVSGLPAPLNILIPEDGSEPKIYYYGSL